MGFMMPWLAVGHYTNVPAYSFMNLAAGSFTLLVGISLSSLIRYVFFSPNEEVLFLRRQTAFSGKPNGCLPVSVMTITVRNPVSSPGSDTSWLCGVCILSSTD